MIKILNFVISAFLLIFQKGTKKTSVFIVLFNILSYLTDSNGTDICGCVFRYV